MSKFNEKQIFEKLRTMKSFNLDNSFEIFFDKQFIVPYWCIDDVAKIYPQYGGNAIYMILQSDRLEFTNIDFNCDPPAIEYRNNTTSTIHHIDNLWFFDRPLPKDALHMKIISNTLIEVGIKETWRQREHKLEKYTPVKLNIYDLVAQSCRDRETFSEYDLLYIGSSKNVYHRLTHHEIILKIYRRIVSTRPNKEIFVWILNPKAKFHKQSLGAFGGLTLSNSVWPQEGPFGIDVESKNILAISEAILINYFKPEYNNHYAAENPNSSQIVYSKLYDAGVKNLQVNLNLFMQKYNNILSIKTPTISTSKAKQVNLYAALENLLENLENNIIFAENMPEELYSFFFGNL